MQIDIKWNSLEIFSIQLYSLILMSRKIAHNVHDRYGDHCDQEDSDQLEVKTK